MVLKDTYGSGWKVKDRKPCLWSEHKIRGHLTYYSHQSIYIREGVKQLEEKDATSQVCQLASLSPTTVPVHSDDSGRMEAIRGPTVWLSFPS